MGQVVKHDFASGRLLDLEADVPDLLQAVDSADTALRDLVHDLRNSRIGPGGLLETLKLAVRDAESQTNARVDLQAEPIRGSALTACSFISLSRRHWRTRSSTLELA